jgi:CheY-like chemotaxis protein
LLQRETFDAVLIDCQLPAVEGRRCAARFAPCRAAPGAGVHLALGVDRERCPPALIDYLNKPVKFEDLQAALERRVLCA